jgi:hypothetical protein
MALERCFLAEAKTFLFLVEEGKFVLRMEKRRKGFLGVVLLGLQCTTWVVAAVKEALLSPGIKDFVKSFREDSKAWIVWKVVIRMAISWSWWSMQWVAGDGFSCFRRDEECRVGTE